MKKVFIHVGLHRTGTTFLQQHVFPKLNANFIHVDAKDINKKLPIGTGINLLSSEYFSGAPLDFKNPNYGATDRFDIADRLKQLYPDAKIILVGREYTSWKDSLYNQYVKSQGYITREHFNEQFDDNYTNFGVYIKYLEKLFGKDKVNILLYEELKINHQKFIDNICKIMCVQNIKVKNVIYNKSLTKGQENILHVLRSITDGMIKKIRFGMEMMNR